jgi:transcriptional regulator GlxA family with amidase domain
MADAASRVGVLVYDGCFASEAFAVLDVLTLANRVAEFNGQPAPFIPTLHAARAGAVSASGGIEMRALRMRYSLDLLVVPGFDLNPAQDLGGRLEAWGDEIALLRRVAARGIPTASICVGAFLLGEAGMLGGRRATTAWLFADELGRRHPDAIVDRHALLIEDGPVTTTGAFSASLDLALHLVRVRAGTAVARTTSKITLTAPGRALQSPYIDETLDERVRQGFSTNVRRDLLANLDREYNLAALAHAHHVSSRTMLRRFRAETGQTPLDFLQAARVSRAKQLLEATDLSVEQIARSVSYRDTGTFRRLFSGAVGLTPSDYRRTFATG